MKMPTLVESNQLICEKRGDIKSKDLGTYVQNLIGNRPVKKICIVSNEHFVLIDSLIYFYRNRVDGLIVRADNLSDELVKKIDINGYTIFKIDDNTVTQINSPKIYDFLEGRISVLTSGSTGVPKIVSHTWESLYTLRSKKESKPLRWLLTYLPGTYAWYQMLTMFMFLPNQTLLVSSSYEPEKIWDFGAENNMNAVSATPTFFRYIFLRKDYKALSKVDLKQITLGGEPVDQSILDMMLKIYPTARVTHIYASTEAGAVIVVNDGKEGFPIEWLIEEDNSARDSRDKPLLKVVNNILWVKSPYSSINIEGWYNTGDMVEIRNNRVVIIGRADVEIMNIGGNKIKVKVIENILLNNDNVIWCKVYSRKSKITGEIVCADVVLKKDIVNFSAKDMEYKLTSHCLSQGLPEWAIPRIWNFLDDIPITKSFKSPV